MSIEKYLSEYRISGEIDGWWNSTQSLRIFFSCLLMKQSLTWSNFMSLQLTNFRCYFSIWSLYYCWFNCWEIPVWINGLDRKKKENSVSKCYIISMTHCRTLFLLLRWADILIAIIYVFQHWCLFNRKYVFGILKDCKEKTALWLIWLWAIFVSNLLFCLWQYYQRR